MVLYRKYRPQRFADLVGQKHICELLTAALASGKISHGYLFAGPRGTGKTSAARIFAKAVNCQRSDVRNRKSDKQSFSANKQSFSTNKQSFSTNKSEIRFGEPCNKCTSCLSIVDGSHLDLIEIDAASNRGIDEIRDLREKIKLSPVSGRFKIYIIDEAHMLTTEAFNALLKTLEEPPGHVIFILCTTVASKIPATILSRLTRFNFKRAAEDEIVKALKKVTDAEKIKIEDEALFEIAKLADGSYRDAFSILDQLAAEGLKISRAKVNELAHISQEGALYDFIMALAVSDLKKSVSILEDAVARQTDFSAFCLRVVQLLEAALLLKIGVGEAEDERISAVANSISFAALSELMKLFLVAEGEIESYPLGHIPLILAACKYCGDVSEVKEVATTEIAVKRPQSTEVLSGKHTGSEVKEKPKHSEDGKTRAGKGKIDPHGPRAESLSSSLQNPPPPRPKGRGSPLGIKSMAQIETLWGEFLSRLKPVNAHLVAMLRATKPTAFDGDRLTLVAFYSFHKDRLEEPKILATCEKILEEVLGQKVRLKVDLAKGGERPPKAVAQSDVVEVSNSEDLASIASEIFSK